MSVLKDCLELLKFENNTITNSLTFAISSPETDLYLDLLEKVQISFSESQFIDKTSIFTHLLNSFLKFLQRSVLLHEYIIKNENEIVKSLQIFQLILKSLLKEKQNFFNLTIIKPTKLLDFTELISVFASILEIQKHCIEKKLVDTNNSTIEIMINKTLENLILLLELRNVGHNLNFNTNLLKSTLLAQLIFVNLYFSKLGISKTTTKLALLSIQIIIKCFGCDFLEDFKKMFPGVFTAMYSVCNKDFKRLISF
jgi:hypothetical protein